MRLRRYRAIRWTVCTLLLGVLAAPWEPLEIRADSPAPRPGPWRIPSPDLPFPWNDTEEVSRMTAVAVSDDGRWIAWATRRETGRGDTLMLRAPDGSPALSLRSRDRIRALAVILPGPRVFAVLVHPRRRASPDVYLAEIAGRRLKRAVSLPASAADLLVDPSGTRLLVACTGEIRSVLLPDVRTGPLFRLPGEHRALDAAGASERVWIGGPGGIRLVDLAKPPGREDLPVLAEIGLPGAEVRDLAVSPDGRHALVVDAGGAVWEIDLEGLEARPGEDRARFVLWPGSKAWRSLAERLPPEPPEPPATLPPAPLAGVAPPPGAASGGETAAQPEIPSQTEAPEAPGAARPRSSRPAPGPAAPEGPSEVRRAEEPSASQPKAEFGEPDLEGGIRIRGRLSGPAASRVRAVVLLGPDNILREFARVAPDKNGIWEVGDLAPGRYRLVLDGGGDTVLVSDPPVIQLEVSREAPVVVPSIRVLRAMER